MAAAANSTAEPATAAMYASEAVVSTSRPRLPIRWPHQFPAVARQDRTHVLDAEVPLDEGLAQVPERRDQGLEWQQRLHAAGFAGIHWPEHLGGRVEPIGDDFEGSSIQVPTGADEIPGLAQALLQRPVEVKESKGP